MWCAEGDGLTGSIGSVRGGMCGLDAPGGFSLSHPALPVAVQLGGEETNRSGIVG